MNVYRPVFSTLTCQIVERVKAVLQREAWARSMTLKDLGAIDRPPLVLYNPKLADPLEAFYGEIDHGITITPTRLRFDIMLHPTNNVEAYACEFERLLISALNSRHPDHNTVVFAWVHKPLFQHILGSKAQITGRVNVDSTFILGTVPPGFFREKSEPVEIDAAAREKANQDLIDKAFDNYQTAMKRQSEKLAIDAIYAGMAVHYVSASDLTEGACDKVATAAFQEMKRRRREERARENEKTNTAVDRNVFWRRPLLREDCLDFRGDDLSNAMSAPAEHMTIHTMMRSPPRVMQATTTPRLFRRIK